MLNVISPSPKICHWSPLMTSTLEFWNDEIRYLLKTDHSHFYARSHTSEKRLLASSCHSVCPHVSVRLPLDGFPWNFILWVFMKIYPENTNLVKIAQKYRTLYMNTYGCFNVKIAIKVFLFNTQYFYIVDNDIQLNNRHRTHCCVSIATTVTRTRHHVTLYLQCLFSDYFKFIIHRHSCIINVVLLAMVYTGQTQEPTNLNSGHILYLWIRLFQIKHTRKVLIHIHAANVAPQRRWKWGGGAHAWYLLRSIPAC
jgi:hypothetical protein